MKNIFLNAIVIFVILAVFLPNTIYAQSHSSQASSLAYLEQTFPKLTSLYHPELMDCHTHYIFAVDVSGSMIKYDDTVTPALQAFAQALPPGEQVTIIPFGTDAKENTPGLCCKIESPAQKQVLSTALSTLYTNDGYSREFRHNTDVNKAIAAVNKAILNNQEAQMNVIVIITDFLNDLPNGGEQKLTDEDLTKLNKDFDNVTSDAYTRVVALQLPPAGSGKGFCLDQLQEKVFCNTSITKRFDIIQAIKDKGAITHWFEQLSRDIMTEKLKAVIQLDNERNLRPTMKTHIDIDGNTTAEIHWTPNKLYKQIKIEATNTDANSDYIFENNEEVWQVTSDTALVDLKLGKLKNKKWGFRKYDEKLNIGMSLPTEYDNELKKLSIDKPIQATSDKQSGWLFTFFIPFWLTVVLAVLLLAYILLIIKAIKRNASESFRGTVDIYDKVGRQIGNTIMVKCKSNSFMVGEGGTNGCQVNGATWTISIEKTTYSPLLVFKKPNFLWKAKKGFAKSGNKQRGYLGRYGNGKKLVSIECGSSYDAISNSITIRLNSK